MAPPTKHSREAPIASGLALLFLTALAALALLPACSGSGTIIPLYTYPTDATWTTVANGKKSYPAVSVVAVINPASGPGNSNNSDYATGTTKLTQAGVLVLGYVATTYGSKAQATVQAEIDRYVAWYPNGVKGIFLDEMNNTAGKESYYSALTAYAKSKSLTYVVGNPGADTIPYVGTVDTIVVYENAGLPALSFLGGWHDSYYMPRFAAISYNVASLNVTFVQQAARHVGFVYVTNDVLSNPYDTLPPYFNSLRCTRSGLHGQGRVFL